MSSCNIVVENFEHKELQTLFEILNSLGKQNVRRGYKLHKIRSRSNLKFNTFMHRSEKPKVSQQLSLQLEPSLMKATKIYAVQVSFYFILLTIFHIVCNTCENNGLHLKL